MKRWALLPQIRQDTPTVVDSVVTGFIPAGMV